MQVRSEVFQTSHMGPVSMGPLSRIIAVLRDLRVRLALRRGAARLDDRALRDIGLIRSDIDAAMSAALSRNASSDVAGSAFLRTGNW